jgi:hypothetical protein
LAKRPATAESEPPAESFSSLLLFVVVPSLAAPLSDADRKAEPRVLRLRPRDKFGHNFHGEELLWGDYSPASQMSFSTLRVVVQGLLLGGGWAGDAARVEVVRRRRVMLLIMVAAGRVNIKWAGNQEAVTFLGYRPIRS